MAEREQVQRPVHTTESNDEPSELATDSARAEKLKSDLDSLLDEIDEVLEDNAEEFVRNYVQKGGE